MLKLSLEAGNFYPDFILWLITKGKQYITFIDPKGIRNLEGVDDPKIQFYRTIKDLETKLGDPNIILNSYIVSVTPFREVEWWLDEPTKDVLNASHVVFQEERSYYIEQILTGTTI